MALRQIWEPLLRIDSCRDRHTTNLAFGGPDGRTLLITEAGSASILTATMDVPGATLFSHG